MKSETIVNDNSQTCQETLVSPYDAESTPVRFDVRKWHKGGSQPNAGYADVMSLAMDKIFSVSEPENYENNMELMGKQHLLVSGLKCQNGCDEYATEKSQGILIDGHPATLLVCEVCAFGGVDE